MSTRCFLRWEEGAELCPEPWGVIQTQPVLAGPQPGLEPRGDWKSLAEWTIALFPRRVCWGFTKSGFAYANVNAIVAGRKKRLLLGTDSPKGRSMVSGLKAKGLGWRRAVPSRQPK